MKEYTRKDLNRDAKNVSLLIIIIIIGLILVELINQTLLK